MATVLFSTFHILIATVSLMSEDFFFDCNFAHVVPMAVRDGHRKFSVFFGGGGKKKVMQIWPTL